MRATLLLVTIVAAGAGIRAAQTDTAHKTVLLAGCLQKTDTEPGFALTRAATLSTATPEQVSAPAVGTTGNTPAPPTGEKGLATYELRPVTGVGESGVTAKELEQHVGTRVEITARPVDQPAPAAPSSKVVTPPPPAQPSEAPARIRLTVSTLKPLGSPCS